MEKLLIVGGEGLIGANMALCLSERFEVLRIYLGTTTASPGGREIARPESVLGPASRLPHRRAARRPARSAGQCAIRQSGLLRHTVDTFQPQWILYCGSAAEGNWFNRGQAVYNDHEPQVVRLLSELAQSSGASLTVLSGDAVFHGPGLWHCEDEPPSPWRGSASLARRIEVAAAGDNVLVVRTHAYGWSPAGGRPGLAEQIWEAAAMGQAQELEPDRYASPILVTDLAELLCTAWQRRVTGLCHIAGAERTSLPRFARELATAFGMRHFRPALCSRRPRRPLPETALGCRRAQRELQQPMPLLRDGLARFAAQATNGYRARLRLGDTPAPALAAG